MEKKVRKIQKTGESSYTVSIPSTWVKDLSLGVDSDLRFSRHGKRLMLTDDSGEVPESEIDPQQGDTEYVLGEVVSAYTEGVGRIIINKKGLSAQDRRDLNEFVRELVGVTVLESQNEVTVQDILDTSEFPPQKAAERALSSSTSAIEEAVDGYIDGNDTQKRTAEVRRLWYLSLRLSNMFFTDPSRVSDTDFSLKETLRYRRYLRELYSTTQEASRISEFDTPESMPEDMSVFIKQEEKSVRGLLSDLDLEPTGDDTETKRARAIKKNTDRIDSERPQREPPYSSMETDDIPGAASVLDTLSSIRIRADEMAEL